MGALAAALLTPTLPAQQPSFGDLNGPYGTGPGGAPSPATLAGPSSGTGDGRVAPGPQADRLRAGALLQDASILLEQALGSYAEVARTARWQSNTGRNSYFFKDKAQFRKASSAAEAFDKDMLEAYGKLVAADHLVDEMEVGGDAYWALEQRLEWTRQATLFDVLHRWGTRRRLKYDTWAFGDEETRALLSTADRVDTLELPEGSGVRDDVVVMPSLVEPMAGGFLDDLEASLEEAEEARSLLEREATSRRKRSLTGWVYLDYTTDSIFDSFVRPQAVRFSVAVARAQAEFNAALLAVESPTRGFSDADHTRLRMLMIRHAKVLVWGDHHRLRRVDWKGMVTRERFLFEGDKLRGRFDLDTEGREAQHWESVLGYMKRQVGTQALD
jgi:hypothetical protein